MEEQGGQLARRIGVTAAKTEAKDSTGVIKNKEAEIGIGKDENSTNAAVPQPRPELQQRRNCALSLHRDNNRI
jgi:hypothetical protein